jgi:hypothetical protein
VAFRSLDSTVLIGENTAQILAAQSEKPWLRSAIYGKHEFRSDLETQPTGECAMVRIEGVDPKKTSFPMRYVFRKIRKMLGRDLTPQKIQARVPRVFWVNVLMERLLGQKAQVPQRLRSILLLRTASRVGCPF